MNNQKTNQKISNSQFRDIIYEKMRNNSAEMTDYLWGLTEKKLSHILTAVEKRVPTFHTVEFLAHLNEKNLFTQENGPVSKKGAYFWRIPYETVYDELDTFLADCLEWSDQKTTTEP